MKTNFVRTPIDVNHVPLPIERVIFQADSAVHRKAAKEFLQTGKWGTLQFRLEGNYTSIPDMIKDKMLDFYLNHEFGSKDEFK